MEDSNTQLKSMDSLVNQLEGYIEPINTTPVFDEEVD